MIKFGTDGIRGIYNTDLTDKIAFLVGKAISSKNKQCIVLIARDTRVSGKNLKDALSVGLILGNAKVIDIGISTTSSVSYLVPILKCDYGVMITASHNSFEYNGIKVFDNKGVKIDSDFQHYIEDFINNNLEEINFEQLFNENKYQLKNVKYARKSIKKYVNFIQNQLKTDNFKTKRKLKVVIDCANGSSYQLAKEVFNQQFLDVLFINDLCIGNLINKDCGAVFTKNLSKTILERKADFGFAFDGDADRFVCVDSKGKIVDGDKILLFYALFFKKHNLLKNNAVVGTKYTNKKLQLILKQNGINYFDAGVGDTEIVKMLTSKDLPIGGENSGHYIFKQLLNTGDGMLSAIMLINSYLENRKLFKKILKTKFYYNENVKVKFENKIKENLIDDFLKSEEFNKMLKNNKRLFVNCEYFLRKSGTEPVIRINVQSKKIKTTKKVALLIKDTLQNYLKN